MFVTRYINHSLTVFSANVQCKIPPAYSTKCSGQILISGVTITFQPPIKHICQTPITAIRILHVVTLNAAQLVKRQAQLDTKTPPIRCNRKPGLLSLFGLPYIVSPTEAEAQCAALDVGGLTQVGR